MHKQIKASHRYIHRHSPVSQHELYDLINVTCLSHNCITCTCIFSCFIEQLTKRFSPSNVCNLHGNFRKINIQTHGTQTHSLSLKHTLTHTHTHTHSKQSR